MSSDTHKMDVNLNVRADVRAKVTEIIMKNFNVDGSKILDHIEFLKDLNADSLNMIEIVMAFEETFNIDIPDSEAAKIKTVGDAIKFIESKITS